MRCGVWPDFDGLDKRVAAGKLYGDYLWALRLLAMEI
jgi:hypothetical protein